MGVETREQRVGVRVICVVCCLQKKPRGRSAPAGIPYCDDDCRGYDALPNVGSLWPGETEEEFGHPVADWGTVKIPKLESTLRVQDAPEVVSEAEGKPSMIKIVRPTAAELWASLESFLNSLHKGACGEYSPEGLDHAQFVVMALRPMIAALLTRPEGEAKVSYRIEREGDAGYVSVDTHAEEKDAREYYRLALVYQDVHQFSGGMRLVKIETYETVIETRTKDRP